MEVNHTRPGLTVEEFKQNPELAQPIIYKAVKTIIFNQTDAEDITQDVIIKAWLKADSFKGESKFSTWLTRIAINDSLILLRKRRNVSARANETALSLDALINPEDPNSARYDCPDPRPSTLNQLIEFEQKQRLEDGIKKLPPRYRTLINYKLEGMRVADMVPQVGTSVAVTKNTLFRARQALKRKVNGLTC